MQKKLFKHFILVLAVVAFICQGCSKSNPDKPDVPEDKMPISNLLMPSSDVIYKPGQALTIQGVGFANGCKILFRQSNQTSGGVEAENLSVQSFGVNLTTPKVYDAQKVFLLQNSKEWLLGNLNFESAPKEQTEISQYGEIKWDGKKNAEVFYEIFVRSFADSNGDGIGDLNGITNKLEYLNSLGISGIWLTPINPCSSYHGYDVTDYKGINKDFGTIEDFEKLIAQAKKYDIKVILDFVINHTGKDHPWFKDACSSEKSKYRDYFLFSQNPSADISKGIIPMTKTYQAGQWHSVETGTVDYKYMGMFSSWMPDLNYGLVEKCEQSAAFEAIVDAGKYWIDKGVAGFRLDAVKHIYQDENSSENPEFLNKFYTALNTYFKTKNSNDIYMVGEVLSEADKAAPYYKGLPALFDFSSWYRLSYAIANSHAKWFPKDMINYMSMYNAVRSDYIDATKLSNHDEERTRTVLGGTASVSDARCRMAAAVLLTSSGSPYIYYGEEIGMYGSKQVSDEGVREPFLWGDSYTTKWITPTYSTSAKVENVSKQQANFKSILNTYKFFIKLRNAYPALANGKLLLPDNFNDSDASDKNFMAFYRVSDTQKLFVLHNVSNSTATYTLDKAIKAPIADTEMTTLTKVSDNKYKITMPAYSSIIIEM